MKLVMAALWVSYKKYDADDSVKRKLTYFTEKHQYCSVCLQITDRQNVCPLTACWRASPLAGKFGATI